VPAIIPVSFTRFGKIFKVRMAEGGCGVELERTAAKRDHYLGIALALWWWPISRPEPVWPLARPKLPLPATVSPSTPVSASNDF